MFVASGVTVTVAGIVGVGVIGVGVFVGQKVIALRIRGAKSQPMYTTINKVNMPTNSLEKISAAEIAGSFFVFLLLLSSCLFPL